MVGVGAAIAAAMLGADAQTALAQADKKAPLDPKATRAYAVAVGLQNKQLYSEAGDRWKQFVEGFPGDPRVANAWHYLGVCRLQEKKYAEAGAAFSTVVSKFPKFESADASQFNFALVKYNIGLASKKPDDFKAAAAAFGDVPAKYKDSKNAPTAYYYQGECLYSAGDAKGAMDAYRALIAAYPKFDQLPSVYYALGTTLQETKQFKEAVDAYGAFLSRFAADEKANEVRLRQGMSLFELKQYADADKVFAAVSAIEGFALADYAALQRAQCLYEQNKLAEAAVFYETLPKKYPKSQYIGTALLAGGKCRFQTDAFGNAEADLTAVVEGKFPEAAEAAYWLGLTLSKLKKHDDAVRLLDNAAKSYSTTPFAGHLAFAKINALFEQPDKIKETPKMYLEFAKSRSEHELAPKSLYMAGLAALRTESYADARQYAEQFLNDPKLAKHALVPDAIIVAGEGYLLSATPDTAKSEAHYRRLTTEFPAHPQAPLGKVRLGLSLLLAKKYDAAVEYLAKEAAGLSDPSLAAEANFLIGRSHSEAGRHDQAAAGYAAAIKAHPKWERIDEVMLAAAITLKSANKPDEATAQLRRLNQDHPKSQYRPVALFQLGEVAFSQKKFADAAGHYEQSVKEFPKSEVAAQAQYGLGAAQFAQDDAKSALASFTKLIESHAGTDSARRGRYARALANQRLKQFEPAVADLQAFLAAKPAEKEALDARYALALCQAGLNKHDDAVASLAAILKDKPDYAHADRVHYEMAFAYLDLKKEQEAADTFRRLTEKTPDSALAPEAWFRIGEFEEKNKKFAEAHKSYSAGLAKAKTADLREKLQYKSGWVLYQAEKFPEASAVLAAQIKEHPKGELIIDAVYLAGECRFKEEKNREALDDFEAVIKSGNKKYVVRAYYRAGTCANSLRQFAKAQGYFEHMLKNTAEEYAKFELINEVRYGLGFALQMQEKLDEAKAVYEEVTKKTDTETAAKSRFMIGECDFKAKKFKEASLHFLEAAEGYPYPEWKALSYLELGRCYVQLNDKKRALESLGEMVKKFPNHPRAKDAADLIAQLKKS